MYWGVVGLSPNSRVNVGRISLTFSLLAFDLLASGCTVELVQLGNNQGGQMEEGWLTKERN